MTRPDEPATLSAPAVVPRVFVCQCGRPIFFRNSICVVCHTPLGYDPESARLLPLEAGFSDGAWRPFGAPPGDVFERCANFDAAAPCNWLVAWNEAQGGRHLCRSCRLNRLIPDLSLPDAALLWGRVELAKRRLVSSLIGLGLPVRSRLDEDLQRGLAFDLLRPAPGGPAVVTGHVDGIITLDVEEADDARREGLRAAMGEPYRTLLGHLRHEVGHYYWWRLVAQTRWQAPFRALFGDERQPYDAALESHYQDGPLVDWPDRHVSAYASAHPWEDWAETWAHYLHMVDTLDTASSFGFDARGAGLRYESFTPDALYRPTLAGAAEFLGFVNSWIELTGVLNELSRSMGQPDLYPFVLSSAAIAKLQFVHLVATTRAPPRMPGKRQDAR